LWYTPPEIIINHCLAGDHYGIMRNGTIYKIKTYVEPECAVLETPCRKEKAFERKNTSKRIESLGERISDRKSRAEVIESSKTPSHSFL